MFSNLHALLSMQPRSGEAFPPFHVVGMRLSREMRGVDAVSEATPV